MFNKCVEILTVTRDAVVMFKISLRGTGCQKLVAVHVKRDTDVLVDVKGLREFESNVSIV